jgi:hypothetical protein
MHTISPLHTSTHGSASLNVAVEQAIAFLIGPLVSSIPAARLKNLQEHLSSSLTRHFSPSWFPTDPARGSGRRCLTLTPGRFPPRPIYEAASRSGMNWDRWMAALGGREFDLFVDPGQVRIRATGDARTRLVWSAAAAASPTRPYKPEPQVADIRTSLRTTMASALRTRVQSSLTLRTDLAAYIASDDAAPSSSDSSISDVGSMFSDADVSVCSSASSVPSIMFTPASPVKTSMSIPRVFPSPMPATTPVSSRRDFLRRAGIVVGTATSPKVYDGGRKTALGGDVRLSSSLY